MSKDTNAAAPESATPAGIALEKPIVRGEQTITHVQLRRPVASELRGVDNSALLRQMDYDALETLLPRITTPTLTRADVQQLDPADFSALGAEVASFFVPKGVMAALTAQLSPDL